MAKDISSASTSSPGDPKAPPTAAAPQPGQPSSVVSRAIGSFGRYQLWICFLMFISKIFIAFNQMAVIFYAPKIEYTCGGSKNVCPCDNPKYNTTIFKKTIVMDWDLICAMQSLVSLNQSFFQFGTLVGSMGFGMASDKWGRKPPLLFAVVLQITMGVAGSFATGYWIFTFLRFLVGLSVGGTMVITFVIVMEFVGTRYRDLLCALYQLPFNIGHVILPLCGYFFREWPNFILCISIPASVQLLYFCFCPESPRWLMAVNKPEKAIALLEKAAKFNKRSTENIKSEVEAFQAAAAKQQENKGHCVDLFKTPNIRKNTLIMAYQWFSCSYCFYGVSQYISYISGNIFIIVLTSALFGLLGSISSIPLLKYLGRKTIVIVFSLLCGSVMLILAFIPEGIGSVLCACIGCVSSFIVFVLVYLYCGELFPTIIRNAAIGFSSMMARVGSMIAPFVVQTRSIGLFLPPLLFAIVPLIGGLMIFWLPETKGIRLMTTIEEAENFGKKKDISNTDYPEKGGMNKNTPDNPGKKEDTSTSDSSKVTK